LIVPICFRILIKIFTVAMCPGAISYVRVTARVT